MDSTHPRQLAKYEQMAKEDNDRYKRGMEAFYKEELAFMCSGNAPVPANLDDNNNKLSVQQQPQVAPPANASAHAPSALTSLGTKPDQARLGDAAFDSLTFEEIGQLNAMMQQQGSESTNKEEIIKRILTERAAIKQRVNLIAQESESLRVKDRMLEQILVSYVASSGATQPVAGSGLGQMSLAGFPHIGQTGAFLNSHQFGLMGLPLDQLGRQKIDNSLLLNQYIASQQLQNQLASNIQLAPSSVGGGFPSAAATTSTALANQSSVAGLAGLAPIRAPSQGQGDQPQQDTV